MGYRGSGSWIPGSLNRGGFSQGVAHLLKRINTPGVVYQPRTLSAWDVEYATTGAAVQQASRNVSAMAQRSYVRRYPLQDPERVNWYDQVEGPVQVDPQLLGGATPIAYELVRSPVLEYGFATIERINTWARLQPLDAQGDPFGPPIELNAVPSNANALPAPANAVTLTSPFPFPLFHPEDPANPGLALALAWGLWKQDVPITADSLPPIQRGISTDNVPLGDPWRVWFDMRYLWNSRGADGHKVMVNGHAIMRMFGAVAAFGAEAQGRWSIQLGGRLTGYTQQSGVKGRGNIDATQRR